MQTHLIAYLNFNGETREALEFYKSCLGGELQIMPIAGTPMEANFPPEMQQRVLHGQLNNGGLVLMASDLTPGPYQAGNNFGVMLACANEAECRNAFEKLSEGADVFDPLGKKFWSELFGGLTDRFGVRWLVGWDPGMSAM